MRCALVTFALLALATSALAADIGMSPTRLDIVVNPGETASATVTIFTSSSAEQQVRSELSDWTLDPSGSIVFLPGASLAFSASPWVDLALSDFMIAPRSSQTVRLDVTAPSNVGAVGTHHAMAFFTVVPPPSDGGTVGVMTTTRVGVTIYVTIAGTEVAGSELVDLYQDDDSSLTAVIVNTGNTVMRLGGVVELRDEGGTVRHRIQVPDVPVLRESERVLKLSLPDDVEPGFYVALALVEDSRGGLLVGELPFDVP